MTDRRGDWEIVQRNVDGGTDWKLISPKVWEGYAWTRDHDGKAVEPQPFDTFQKICAKQVEWLEAKRRQKDE